MQPKNLRNPIFFTQRILPLLLLKALNCVKSVGIQSYSGPHFSALLLNTEIYGVSLRTQYECGKIWELGRTRITPNKDTFYAVLTFQTESW